jgi:hypothetical protein
MYWNKKQAAEWARCHPNTLMRKVAAGLITPPRRMTDGGTCLFDVDTFKQDVEKLLNQPHKAEAARTLTDEQRAMGRAASLAVRAKAKAAKTKAKKLAAKVKGGRAHAAAP